MDLDFWLLLLVALVSEFREEFLPKTTAKERISIDSLRLAVVMDTEIGFPLAWPIIVLGAYFIHSRRTLRQRSVNEQHWYSTKTSAGFLV